MTKPSSGRSRNPDKQSVVSMELAPALGRNWGPTLADLRTRLGGADQGEFTDPRFGIKHAVDLRPWAELPPDTHFKLGFHYPVEGSPRDRRRLGIESLLTSSSAMPQEADEARTLDEILDATLHTQRVVPRGDGTYEDQEWKPSSPRQLFAEMPNTPSRQRLRRTLRRLVDRGVVFQRGKGTRREPYRYWRASAPMPGMRGRWATAEENREIWRRMPGAEGQR